MFSFGKKKEEINITDIVFISVAAKWHACMEAFKQEPKTVFITWFEDTQQQLQSFFTQQNITGAEIILYRQSASHFISNKQVIFAEHYPMRDKEINLYKSLNLAAIKVFSCLEDALFQYFGGNNLIEMLQKMGMSENEPLQHPMIAAALKNAQEKIASKVSLEQTVRSQTEWFSRNLPPHKE